MSTGTIRPSLACAWVAALNSLQKPMMFTPCWPSAGPTGGLGFALPAGHWSFTCATIFFIRSSRSGYRVLPHAALDAGQLRRRGVLRRLRLLDLVELEFDRHGATE